MARVPVGHTNVEIVQRRTVGPGTTAKNVSYSWLVGGTSRHAMAFLVHFEKRVAHERTDRNNQKRVQFFVDPQFAGGGGGGTHGALAEPMHLLHKARSPPQGLKTCACQAFSDRSQALIMEGAEQEYAGARAVFRNAKICAAR